MRRNFFEVVNVGKDSTVGKIKIYGVIGDWWDGTTVNSFIRSFQDLESKYDTIHVHINSPGGSVYDGLAIANAIKSSSKDVHTFNNGIAMSMGGIILMAAKKGNVHSAKGALIMIHSASTYAYGNSQSLRETADNLEKYDDSLISFVTDRTGKTHDEVKGAYFNHKDHFFTSSEALAEGFIDEIEDYEAEETPDNVQNMSLNQVAAWYMNQEPEPTESYMAKIISNVKNALKIENNGNMFGDKFSKLGALAKVAAGSITAELIEGVNAQIKEAKVEGVTLVLDSELETVRNTNETLTADKTALETKVTALESDVEKKDKLILDLQNQVKAFGKKPAEESGSPDNKNGDNIPAGDGGANQVDNFETEFDREAQALFGSN